MSLYCFQFTFHIRAAGSWTTSLREHFEQEQRRLEGGQVEVRSDRFREKVNNAAEMVRSRTARSIHITPDPEQGGEMR